MLDSINDDKLGNLASFTPTDCDNLAPGATCTFDVPWTVPDEGWADPTVNTVTVHYHPVNFPNDIFATDSHELNLFQPSVTFDKTADTELSKATDVVNYTLTLDNTSSPDSPDLACTVTDAMLGVNKQVTLESGRERCHRCRLHGAGRRSRPVGQHRLVLLQPDRVPERAQWQ